MKKAGEILKEARLSQKIDLDLASNELKIHKRFLEALENSDYSIFSDVVQIKGFIKNYAKFLKLNENEVLAFWRREYEEKEVKQAEGIKDIMKPMFASKFIITPGTLLFAFTVASILGFLTYLYFQYRSFAGAPYLAVESPSTNISINTSSLDVFGKIDKDSELFLNGQQISLINEGNFAITVSLSNGLNTLTFKAVNKLGKETVLTRTVLVNNPMQNTQVLGESGSSLTLKIEITDSASLVSVSTDGKPVFKDVAMLKGRQETFTAKDSITIKAGNANVVEVYLNGKDLGILGEGVVEKTFNKN